MREMRDSGVPWIGEVPVGWEVRYPKFLFAARTERAREGDVMLTASQQYGMIPQREFMAKESYKPVLVDKGHDILKHVEPGDFIISMRSFQGGLEYSKYSGKMSSAYLALYPVSESVYPSYYRWLFKSAGYIQGLQSTTNLIRDGQALRYANFLNVWLPVPPFPEQRRIADWLDERCADIDAAIEAARASIDEYEAYKKSVITCAVTRGLDPDVPLKDTGIPWLGQVPEGWEMRRVKNIATFSRGLNILKTDLVDDVGTACVSYGEAHGRLKFSFDAESDYIRKVPPQFTRDGERSLVRQGDFIFADTSEDIEGSGDFTCNFGTEPVYAGYHSHIVRLRDKNAIYHRFLAYEFESQPFRVQIQQTVSGVKVYTISVKTIGNAEVFLPPLPEQRAIADYLDSRTSAIDAVVAQKRAIVEDLLAYKKSLIYEAVTGKREV